MTTNQDRVTAWFIDKPKWAESFTARDWDTAELVARKLDSHDAPEPESCKRVGGDMYCVLQAGHTGPCDCRSWGDQ